MSDYPPPATLWLSRFMVADGRGWVHEFPAMRQWASQVGSGRGCDLQLPGVPEACFYIAREAGNHRRRALPDGPPSGAAADNSLKKGAQRSIVTCPQP